MLSTVIPRKILDKTRNYSSKIISMDSKKPETLGEYVRRIRREKGLATTDVEKRSRIGGKIGISNGYITQIENDPSVNPSMKKLQALADGLGVPEEEIISVVRGKTADNETVADERFRIISLKFHHLKGDKRRDAEALLRALERAVQES
jgi:transcriptional regulator with XRE-family HTH domain